MEELEMCMLCPRKCGVDRKTQLGFCGCTNEIKVARAALHFWEEPCISGKNGSGTIFFSGCTLKCCFCQNYKISHQVFGKAISEKRLAQIFMELQDKGANNINLVTPTHYLPGILRALDMVKKNLNIPVVYNCGGYESVDTIELLKDYVDIFLQDIKYYDDNIAMKYSKANNYFKIASAATLKMIAQTGKLMYNSEGLMERGVIVRHMVLPGQRKDSIKILDWLNENVSSDNYVLSLMSQYTPFYKSEDYQEINRRVTSYEYDSVVSHAVALGMTNGYMQEKSSAKEEYTPPFDLEGV